MTIEEKLTAFSDILKEENLLVAKGIYRENHKPHPFTIGSKHIAYASDNHGGILGEETLQKIGCAHSKCNLSYEEHTSDEILFLQLTRNATNAEANEELLKIKPSLLILKVDGIAFVDTEEKYRFLEDEKA